MSNEHSANDAIMSLDGQPIKQRVLRRTFRATAEVGDRLDQRLAEMAGPNVVHCHTCRKRVLSIGDPTCQCGAAAGADRRIRPATRRVRFIGALKRFERSGE